MAASAPGTAPVQGSTARPRARDAYQQLSGEIDSVPATELITVNIDIRSAVATVLGVLPKVQSLRSRIAALPEFDIERFDKLEAYALALAHAHTLYLAASMPPPTSLKQLVASGTALREVLLAGASKFAKRRLVDGQRLRELGGSAGHLELASDLSMLATIVRASWFEVCEEPLIDLLDQADLLSGQLQLAEGGKGQLPTDIGTSSLNRRRAFTLLVKAYDQVRRAVYYLKWMDGDQDILAPSLYSGRGGRRKNTPMPAPPTTVPTATGPLWAAKAPANLSSSSPLGVVRDPDTRAR